MKCVCPKGCTATVCVYVDWCSSCYRECRGGMQAVRYSIGGWLRWLADRVDPDFPRGPRA